MGSHGVPVEIFCRVIGLSFSIDPAAEGDVPFHREEDHPPQLVRQAEHEDLGGKAGDAAHSEIDGGDHQTAGQIARLIEVHQLGAGCLFAERSKIEPEFVGGLSSRRVQLDANDPANSEVERLKGLRAVDGSGVGHGRWPALDRMGGVGVNNSSPQGRSASRASVREGFAFQREDFSGDDPEDIGTVIIPRGQPLQGEAELPAVKLSWLGIRPVALVGHSAAPRKLQAR